eukprot:scaffold13771_cov105-Isochrysis_galbana.AAC.4
MPRPAYRGVWPPVKVILLTSQAPALVRRVCRKTLYIHSPTPPPYTPADSLADSRRLCARRPAAPPDYLRTTRRHRRPARTAAACRPHAAAGGASSRCRSHSLAACNMLFVEV